MESKNSFNDKAWIIDFSKWNFTQMSEFWLCSFVFFFLFYLLILIRIHSIQFYFCMIFICEAHFCLHILKPSQWLDRTFLITMNALTQKCQDLPVKHRLGKNIRKSYLLLPLSSVVNQNSWVVNFFSSDVLHFVLVWHLFLVMKF